MPTSQTCFPAILAAIIATATLAPAAARPSHHRRHHHGVRRDLPTTGARRPYASTYSPTTTCRTADGTPYDPDLIGGVNHVGDGGPAMNFGSGLGNPCDPVYLGGPGLIGPR